MKRIFLSQRRKVLLSSLEFLGRFSWRFHNVQLQLRLWKCVACAMHIGNSRRVGRSFTLFGSKFPFQVHQRKTYLMNTSARGFFFDHCWTVVLDTTGFARSFARSLQRGCGSRSGFHHALPQPFHSHSSGHNFFSSTDKCASPV